MIEIFPRFSKGKLRVLQVYIKTLVVTKMFKKKELKTPQNGNDLAIKFYVDDKINNAKSHQMETITKSFQLRNKRVSELESKVIKMITHTEYIHNLLKELFDKLENLNKFINQHLKKPPIIIRSDQTQIDGTILRKRPFSRRE